MDIPHNWPAPYPASLQWLAARIAWYCDVATDELTAGSRTPRLVEARSIIAYLGRELTGCNAFDISIVLDVYPQTIYRMQRKIEERIIWDQTFRQRVNEIRRLFP